MYRTRNVHCCLESLSISQDMPIKASVVGRNVQNKMFDTEELMVFVSHSLTVVKLKGYFNKFSKLNVTIYSLLPPEQSAHLQQKNSQKIICASSFPDLYLGLLLGGDL